MSLEGCIPQDLTLDSIFQRYYTVARQAAMQPQAPAWMVKALREHLQDDRLDIRKRKINGRRYWAVLRYSHPREVFGSLAREGHGLTHLPVSIYHFRACEVCGEKPDTIHKCPNERCPNHGEECRMPREIGIQDVEDFTRCSPKEYQERLVAAYEREQKALHRMCSHFDDAYRAEMKPYRAARSFGTRWMVEENDRRIRAGEA